MCRAKSSFESQGIAVIPAHCNFVSQRHPDGSFRLPWMSSEALDLWGPDGIEIFAAKTGKPHFF
jgi:hypothetical protein